ncbi:MAG: hypothetical protein RID23_12400 [Roseovarius sp.]
MRLALIGATAGAIWPNAIRAENLSDASTVNVLALCHEIYIQAAEETDRGERQNELLANSALLEEAVQGWKSLNSHGLSEADPTKLDNRHTVTSDPPETREDCDRLLSPGR